MKKLAILLSITLLFLVSGCGGGTSQDDNDALSLVGNWTATGEEKYHCGIITDDSIEIYWIGDTLDSNTLYWAGSYEAPTEKTDTYSWESKNDKSKTENAMLASGDDTKTFTYENGKLTFSFSVGDMEGESVLVMTDEDFNTELGTTGEDFSKDVEVLSEYTLSSYGTLCRYMVVKNNSEKTLDITTSSLAYKEDGTMVSAANSELLALGAGCTSIVFESFETDETVSRFDTELKGVTNSNHKSVIQDLSYVQNDIADGAIFQITNNGDEDALFVEGYALFFSGDKLVDWNTMYFTDDNSELKSGETITEQMTTSKDFDRIEFYMTGWR